MHHIQSRVSGEISQQIPLGKNLVLFREVEGLGQGMSFLLFPSIWLQIICGRSYLKSLCFLKRPFHQHHSGGFFPSFNDFILELNFNIL